MQSILNPKPKNSTVTRQDTARHSRDFSQDTSSNKINTFKGTAFGLSSFLLLILWNFIGTFQYFYHIKFSALEVLKNPRSCEWGKRSVCGIVEIGIKIILRKRKYNFKSFWYVYILLVLLSIRRRRHFIMFLNMLVK